MATSPPHEIAFSGPLGARRLLRRRGGVLQHDDGRVEVVPAPAVVRLPEPVAA